MSTPKKLIALALFALVACGDDAAPKKNVILITLDTTRADYLSCYGVHAGVTPNLDALAAQGTRFDMAISTAGVTPVSHASILTGLNNQEHRLRVLSADGGFRLPDDVATLATVLAKEGYKTVAVHSALPVSRHFGFQRGFEVFEDLNGEITTNMRDDEKRETWDVKTFQRRSDETTDLVEKSLGGDEPYFLWIHYWDPHDWSRMPPDEAMPPKELWWDAAKEQPVRPGLELYKAELRYEDAQIGRLFEWLKSKGLLENTIVVVTADHGQGLMEHEWAAHRLLYQEQVHVPLIIDVPGAQQAAAVKDLVRTIDIYPTILDLVGVQPPKPVSGRSLRALIAGKPDEKRIAFADQINGYDTNAGMTGKRPFDHFLYMAIDWPWKLIYRPLSPDKSLLYDLAKDPDEANNLYASEHEVRVRLLRELAKARPWVVGEFEPAAGAQSADVKTGMNELGYTAGQTFDPTWIWICPEHLEQQVESATSRCSLCKGPPIMVVDPACIWVCGRHADQTLSGPDGVCPVEGCDAEPKIVKPGKK